MRCLRSPENRKAVNSAAGWAFKAPVSTALPLRMDFWAHSWSDAWPRPAALPDADLEALVRAHYAGVLRLVERLIGRRGEALDLAQETFLRARGRVRADDPGAGAYLRRTAINLAAGWWRGRGRAAAALELPEQLPGAAQEPVVLLAQAELEDALRAAIARLPERCRQAFVGRVIEGLEYADLARSLGIAEATARQHVMDARQRLQRALAPFYGSGPGAEGRP